MATVNPNMQEGLTSPTGVSSRIPVAMTRVNQTPSSSPSTTSPIHKASSIPVRSTQQPQSKRSIDDSKVAAAVNSISPSNGKSISESNKENRRMKKEPTPPSSEESGQSSPCRKTSSTISPSRIPTSKDRRGSNGSLSGLNGGGDFAKPRRGSIAKSIEDLPETEAASNNGVVRGEFVSNIPGAKESMHLDLKSTTISDCRSDIEMSKSPSSVVSSPSSRIPMLKSRNSPARTTPTENNGHDVGTDTTTNFSAVTFQNNKNNSKSKKNKNFEAFVMTGDRMINLAKTPANSAFKSKHRPRTSVQEQEASSEVKLRNSNKYQRESREQRAMVRNSKSEDQLNMENQQISPPEENVSGSVNTLLHEEEHQVHYDHDEDNSVSEYIDDGVVTPTDNLPNNYVPHMKEQTPQQQNRMSTSSSSVLNNNKFGSASKQQHRKRSLQDGGHYSEPHLLPGISPPTTVAPSASAEQDMDTSSLMSCSEHYNAGSVLVESQILGSPSSNKSPESPDWSLLDSFHKKNGQTIGGKSSTEILDIPQEIEGQEEGWGNGGGGGDLSSPSNNESETTYGTYKKNKKSNSSSGGNSPIQGSKPSLGDDPTQQNYSQHSELQQASSADKYRTYTKRDSPSRSAILSSFQQQQKQQLGQVQLIDQRQCQDQQQGRNDQMVENSKEPSKAVEGTSKEVEKTSPRRKEQQAEVLSWLRHSNSDSDCHKTQNSNATTAGGKSDSKSRESINDSTTSLSGESDISDIESLHSYHPPAKVVDLPSAVRLAKRLYYLDGFRKTDVSRHLSKNTDYNHAVAEEYLKLFDFFEMPLDKALRQLLSRFCLTGETQERERVLFHFSRRYLQCNDILRDHSFRSADAVHTLTCAIMLLNTDLHGAATASTRKMTCPEFVENLADLNDGHNFPEGLLRSIYSSIKNNPIPWITDQDVLEPAMAMDVTPPKDSLFPDGIIPENPSPSRKKNSNNATAKSGPNIEKSSQSAKKSQSSSVQSRSSDQDETSGRNPIDTAESINIGKSGAGGYNPFLTLPDAKKTKSYKKGYVMRKSCVDANGKKTKLGKRSWRMFYIDLREMTLFCFKDEKSSRVQHAYESANNAVRLHHALAVTAVDYTKKHFVFRLFTADRAQYLFQTSDDRELLTWIETINHAVASHSSAPLPAACSSGSRGDGGSRRFERPLMPSSKTTATVDRQLDMFEGKLNEARVDREETLRSIEESQKKKKQAEAVNFLQEKLDFLEFEILRYETYILTLRTKNGILPNEGGELNSEDNATDRAI